MNWIVACRPSAVHAHRRVFFFLSFLFDRHFMVYDEGRRERDSVLTQWLPWLWLGRELVSRIQADFDSRWCMPRPGRDPWCLARSTGLGCQVKSVWLWSPDANLSLRQAETGTPYPMDKHSDGTGPVRICILADWLDSRLWKSFAICTNHFPMESTTSTKFTWNWEKNAKN